MVDDQGRAADRSRAPLALYGWLEIGIAALALLMLLIEWWYYHRRTV